MSSAEQTSTKGTKLQFPPMASVSVPITTSLATITEPVQVQNTAALNMYTVPVSNIAVNQQQGEIPQIVPEPMSATPTFQENLDKMMSRMTQMENIMSQMQANVPVAISNICNSPIFLQTLLSLQQQRPFETLFILSKTRFPCILESYSLSMQEI